MVELVKKILRPVYFFYKGQIGSWNLKKAVRKGSVKIVIGASGEFDKGWTATDIEFLNILKPEDWERFFQPESVEMMMAEHVWEHLSPDEALDGAINCFSYLKHGGHLRVAVPDGNHADPDYIEKVKPGGYGYGSDDHKVLYTIASISQLFEKAGFRVKGLEYFDTDHKFIDTEWSLNSGKIRRSKRFDPRNTNGAFNYSSLIIDAIKD